MNKQADAITILLIEDNPLDARLIKETLSRKGCTAFGLEYSDRLSAGIERLDKGGIDLVLLDLALPDSHGFETFTKMQTHSPEIPIVVLTGLDDESIAIKAVQEGAQDYLVKGQVDSNLLVRCIRYAIERKKAEIKLNEMLAQIEKSHGDMLSILNQLRLATAMTDERGYVTFLSQEGKNILGKSHEDTVGKHWEELFPFEEREKADLKAMSERPYHLRSKVLVHMETPRGRKYWIEVNVHDDPRNPKRKIFYLYDISDVYNLRRQLDEKARFHDLVGKSKSMQHIYQQIREVSRVDWTALIEGDTGTGKELVARAIHFSSYRKDKPFLVINCAILTDSLLASQLFGHKRGAFTGAVEDHQGLFEAAGGGTIFLDEIGDVPLNTQTSLLRAIEQKEITRLGESKTRKVDVRVITATHRNLSQAVKKGEFREDLLYRIRIARIQLPPLRERREDIPLLVNSFLEKCNATTGKAVQDVNNKTMRKLLDYSWPGNVRELKSAIECAVTRCKGSIIQVEDLPPELTESAPLQLQPLGGEQNERQLILDALKQAGGKRTVAAKLLGISRATLYRRLADLDLKPES